MDIEHYHTPQTAEQALAILGREGHAAMILAGGTDIMVRAHRGLIPPRITTLVSLDRIAELRGIRQVGGELVIGATTTAADLIGDRLVAERAPILACVAGRMACPQVRNAATIGGNLANASPAGDLINPLLLLDARLVVAGGLGRRTISIEEFFTGPGETVLEHGELLVEIRCHAPPTTRVFRFEKAGTRPAMECSLVTVGIAYTRADDDCCTEVRVAIGSCAPTPLRARQAEAALEGQPLTAQAIEQAVRAADDDICPIDDVRGSARYRRALVGVMLRRLLDEQQ